MRTLQSLVLGCGGNLKPQGVSGYSCERGGTCMRHCTSTSRVPPFPPARPDTKHDVDRSTDAATLDNLFINIKHHDQQAARMSSPPSPLSPLPSYKSPSCSHPGSLWLPLGSFWRLLLDSFSHILPHDRGKSCSSSLPTSALLLQHSLTAEPNPPPRLRQHASPIRASRICGLRNSPHLRPGLAQHSSYL